MFEREAQLMKLDDLKVNSKFMSSRNLLNIVNHANLETYNFKEQDDSFRNHEQSP